MGLVKCRSLFTEKGRRPKDRSLPGIQQGLVRRRSYGQRPIAACLCLFCFVSQSRPPLGMGVDMVMLFTEVFLYFSPPLRFFSELADFGSVGLLPALFMTWLSVIGVHAVTAFRRADLTRRSLSTVRSRWEDHHGICIGLLRLKGRPCCPSSSYPSWASGYWLFCCTRTRVVRDFSVFLHIDALEFVRASDPFGVEWVAMAMSPRCCLFFFLRLCEYGKSNGARRWLSR